LATVALAFPELW